LDNNPSLLERGTLLKKYLVVLLIITALYVILYYNHNYIFEPAFTTNRETKLVIYGSNFIKEYYGEEKIKVSEKNLIYLSLDILKTDLNINLDYDSDDKVAIITTDDKVIRFYGKDSKVKINNAEKNIKQMIFVDEKPMIPINEIEKFIHIESKFIEESNTVMIRNLYRIQIVAEAVRDNIKVKDEKSLWAKNKDTLMDGEKVYIIKKGTKWIEILTDKGIKGYIKINEVKNSKEIVGKEKIINLPIWKPEKGKVFLTWEHVYSKNPDTDEIGKMSGVNIVSPTWISLKNSSGELKNNISEEYIEWARNRGYKIWVLFSNSFDPDLTHEFLNNSLAREKVIEDLLRMIKENDMDGVNIDFENVYLKDKEKLVQFVRELTPVFHENGLVVSMDVTVKGGSENWSLFYDRKALGEVVDYMAVMTYDEHWASSPVSGSVASLDWVERGIKGVLEEVPAEKLLLGIPFYTRVWIETPSTKEVNKMDVRSKAITMETVNEILKKKNITKLWDEKSGQYYVVYIEDNKLHKIWVEDSKSIRLKAQLVNKYGLAGVATWRRGFETDDIWDTIDQTLTGH
jgi:spore germination protein YaaH